MGKKKYSFHKGETGKMHKKRLAHQCKVVYNNKQGVRSQKVSARAKARAGECL